MMTKCSSYHPLQLVAGQVPVDTRLPKVKWKEVVLVTAVINFLLKGNKIEVPVGVIELLSQKDLIKIAKITNLIMK